MKWKAALILIVILAASTAFVFLLLYGIGNRGDVKTGKPVPSEAAARTYVLDNKLLSSISGNESIVASGPTFRMLTGYDSGGAEKVVWLSGKDARITNHGSVLTKDGVPKERIVAKLKEQGVAEDQIQYLFITPYDYTSGRIVWFAQDKSVRHRVFWFDFATGDLIRDDVLDPTAWSLKKD